MGAQAQELKIGYVNLDKVLRDATPAKAAQKPSWSRSSADEKDLVELEQRLKSASDKFERIGLTLARASAPPPTRFG